MVLSLYQLFTDMYVILHFLEFKKKKAVTQRILISGGI